MKFSDYIITDDLKRNLDKMGFKRPTDIQFKAIPPILKGEDLLAVAQTGTGKTAAFAIPVIHRINQFKKNRRSYGIKALIMVPTRELAQQIGQVFEQLAKGSKVKIFALYGGVDQEHQIRKLESGIDVLITTPGRMFDLIHQKYIGLKSVSTLILDEADHMLDLGFIKDIESIKKLIPGKHQTLFFSATIDKKIKRLAYTQVNNDAIRIQVSPKDPVAKNVFHYVVSVEPDDKRFFLENLIRNYRGKKFIVFVRTRVRAERVSKAMGRVGIPAITIHGDRTQGERFQVMEQFRAGDVSVLIATDVSARGIDIAGVFCVVNYDLPEKVENYVHRVGRTGRGTEKGVAITFCAKEDQEQLDAIEAFITKPIEEIHISKNGYNVIRSQEEKDQEDWQALVAEEEMKEQKKKIKKVQKKKKK